MHKDTKPPISPRKEAKQERSKSLIEAVMEATTRILTSMGYEKTTTNRVAEVAGISIGSLYQYFPNKDALLASLIERHLLQHKKVVAQILSENNDQPIDVVIEKVIIHMVNLFLSKKVFLRSLFIHFPRLEKTREVLFARNEVIEILIPFLEAKKDSLIVKDIRTSLTVLVSSILGTLHTAMLSEPQILSSETISTELTHLAKRYLLIQRTSE